jgi:hypothetical protein
VPSVRQLLHLGVVAVRSQEPLPPRLTFVAAGDPPAPDPAITQSPMMVGHADREDFMG